MSADRYVWHVSYQMEDHRQPSWFAYEGTQQQLFTMMAESLTKPLDQMQIDRQRKITPETDAIAVVVEDICRRDPSPPGDPCPDCGSFKHFEC